VEITIKLTESAGLIFLLYGHEKLLTRLGIEDTTLNLSSQTGIVDHSAMGTHKGIKSCTFFF